MLKTFFYFCLRGPKAPLKSSMPHFVIKYAKILLFKYAFFEKGENKIHFEKVGVMYLRMTRRTKVNNVVN